MIDKPKTDKVMVLALLLHEDGEVIKGSLSFSGGNSSFDGGQFCIGVYDMRLCPPGKRWSLNHGLLYLTKCKLGLILMLASLEEFIQTSSIGEFRKRLQLVFAFHGHISTAISRESNIRCGYENTVKILYNTFGFCIQFLPIVMEQLTCNRKAVETELNELLKLCK